MFALLILFVLALVWLLVWLMSRPSYTPPKTPTVTTDSSQPTFRTVSEITYYYIPGKLQAKYWAESATDYSPIAKEQSREIHVSEAEVFAEYDEAAGPENQQRLQEQFAEQSAEFISPLPDPLPTTITRGNVIERYQLKFSATKVFGFSLKDIQHEGRESFGTVTGKFIGQIKKVTTRLEPKTTPEIEITSSPEITADRVGGISQLKSFGHQLYERTRFVTSAGRSWSSWKPAANTQPAGCWSALVTIAIVVVSIFVLLVVIAVLVAVIRALFH